MTNSIQKIVSILILIIASSFIYPRHTNFLSPKVRTLFYSGKLEIGADLNGDKKIEKVYIEVISENNNKQLDSITFNADYNDYLIQFEKIKPRIILKSNHKIPEIILNKDPRILSPMNIDNLGDLNNDGNDEIGYVLEWFEVEKTDSMHILSFKNKQWNKIGSVPISIYYSEKYYSVDTDGLIIKKNNKLYYKNKNNEEIEFTLKK
jgi:hypothetical protein